MSMNSYEPTMGSAYLNNSNGFWGQFGNGDPAGMTGAQSMGVNLTRLMQSAGFDTKTKNPLLSIDPKYQDGYRSTSYSFGQDSGSRFGGGSTGAPGGSAGGGGGAAGGGGGSLTANTIPTMAAPAQTAPALAGSGAAGAGGSMTVSGVGGATGGASSGFWGAAKGFMGNKALMSGLVTAFGSAYGQYSKKKEAKAAYEWQSNELERQREWQREQAERKRNSPAAKMAPFLIQYYLPQIVSKMKSRNNGGNNAALDQMLAALLGGG